MAKTYCWQCGAEMIWGCDFSFEDYGIEGEGVIAEMSCSSCPTTATFYTPLDEAKVEVKKDIAKEVIEYLNKAIGTRYKPTTTKTKKCINARKKEGYTFDDFKLVIDKKTKEWLDTDMEKYLRPDTLFGNNFEIYLNQKGCDNGNNIIRSSKQNFKSSEKFKGINFKGGI